MYSAMYPDQNQHDPNQPRVFSPNQSESSGGANGWPTLPPQNSADGTHASGSWPTNPQQPTVNAQLPAYPQAPAAAPQQVMQQAPTFSDNKRNGLSISRLILLVLLVLVVLGGLGFGGYLVYKHVAAPKKPVATAPAVPLAKPARQLCSQAGTAIICQDLSTGTTLKYETPRSIGAAYAILPSPDDSKIFVDTPANTVKDPSVSDHFYIFDKQLQALKQLPDEKSTEDYLGFDWTADSKSLVYARRELNDQKQFDKASLYLYNMNTAQTKKLAGGNQYDFSVPQVSRNGQSVYVENNAGASSGTLSLASVNVLNGQVQTISSGSVMQSMQSFTTYTYSRIQNLFYVSGISAATDQPIFIIAQLTESGGALQLQPVKVLDDGYTYTPLTSTATGMIVSRAKGDTTTYGLIKSDGSFAAMQVSPSPNAPFGLNEPLSLKAAASSVPVAADYLYEDTATAPPTHLQKFLESLVTNGCQAGNFNTVALLGQTGGTQAVVHFTPCSSDNSRTQYYVAQGSSFKNVLETQATTIPCTTMTKLQLSKELVPSCSTTP